MMAFTHRHGSLSKWSIAAASIVVVVAVIVLMRLTGAEAPGAILIRHAPNLDPRLADALVSGTDDELAAVCDALDAHQLIDHVGLIIDSIDDTSLAAYESSLAQTMPAIERLAAIVADRGHSQGPQTLVRYLREHPTSEGLRVTRLKNEVMRVHRTTDAPVDEKYRAMQALSDSLAGCPWSETYIESRMVELSADAGQDHRKRAHLYRGIRLAREAGLTPQLSHMLGTLCDDRLAAGRRDTAMLLADEALELALAARLPAQAGRIHTILAAYHRGRGELSLAAEHYDEAVAVARRLDAGYIEVRFLAARLAFHADLGCWDLVGRRLPRAELLLGQVTLLNAEPRQASYLAVTLRTQAGYLTHVGRHAAADSVYACLAELTTSLPRNYDYATVLADWSSWLVERGEHRRAIALAYEGLAYVRREGLGDHGRRLHTIIASGHVAAGRADSAAIHLARSVDAGPPSFETSRLALQIAELQGDASLAAVHADAALADLLTRLSAWGERVEVYLMLSRLDGFREQLHRHFADDPRGGLAVELAWRQLRRYATTHHVTGAGGTVERLLAFGRSEADELADWTRTGDDRALVYARLGDQVLRWQIIDGSVACDSIPANAVAPLLAVVPLRLAEGVATPHAPVSRELARELAEVTEVLMPDWVRADTGGRLLIATTAAVDPLALEACNLGDPADYQPLAARWQTAYLRLVDDGPTAASDNRLSCVVGVPELSSSLKRERPSLRSLPYVRVEAELAAARLPDPVLLMDAAARKQAILEHLPRARMIYLAGHATHDPEMPYRSYLPCAADPADHDPVGDRLTFADILGRDLSGCELVVLSSCRSASGHAIGTVTGPSLADAFTDAGAAGVIAARWTIEDAAAAAFMSEFLARTRGAGLTGAWDALSEVRRRHIAADSGANLTWLTYELEVGHLPR